jgi:two-component system LytT family response regulator
MRVLIADDEPLARQRIEDLLRKEPDVEIAGTSEDGVAAADAIRALRPDLVFLDIQMPGKTGLQVVSEVGVEDMPATIFVTAYDRHAIQAFDVAAVDYLVKPFDDERFAVALARARERIRLQEVERVTKRLLSVLGDTAPASADTAAAAAPKPAAPPETTAPSYLESIAVESRGRVEHVPVAAIDAIVARGPYAELRVGEATHLVRERMQALEARLDPARFVRIHRSAIVPVDRIESIQRHPGGEATVRLRGGLELTVSRSRRQELERRWAAMPRTGRPL